MVILVCRSVAAILGTTGLGARLPKLMLKYHSLSKNGSSGDAEKIPLSFSLRQAPNACLRFSSAGANHGIGMPQAITLTNLDR